MNATSSVKIGTVTLLATIVLGGCFDPPKHGPTIIPDTSTEQDTDRAVIDDEALLLDAFNELLSIAPPMCVDFCRYAVACQLGFGDIDAREEEMSGVKKRLNESCIVDCAYPMQAGTYILTFNETTEKMDVKRVLDGDEYTALAQCVGLLEHQCVDRKYVLDLSLQAPCEALDYCLGQVDDFNRTCAWEADGPVESCECQMIDSIPEIESLLGA